MTRGGEVAERGGRAAGHADAEIGVVELPFLPAASRDGRPSLESPSVGARRRRVHPLGPSAASAVTRLANRLGVTPADVVAAAYTAVLHRYQATDRLIVGLHHHDGPRSFVVDGSGEPAAAEWIRRIVDALDGAHDHDDAETGTCRLVRDRPPQGEGAEVTLGMAPDEGDLTLVMELEERAGSHPAAPRFLAHVANVVAGFVDQPATPIDALPIVTDGERALLAQWNDTDRTYPGHPTLVDLFDQQVARTPTAVALVGPEGDQLTYRDLAHRVAQLAGWLQVNGVGPGSRVGVLAERAPELVVALHAVLRAGGAYVPLDPEYPAERLAFMADEAELSIVLTQQHLRAVVPLLVEREHDAVAGWD
ncbi:MAG: AMP-binding protein, partial [Actinomycetota bacterium]